MRSAMFMGICGELGEERGQQRRRWWIGWRAGQGRTRLTSSIWVL